MSSAERTRHRRRWSAVRVVGVLLLALGVAALGYVGYQYFGTNLVAERTFSSEKKSLRSQWEQQSVAPTPSAARTASKTPATPKGDSPVPGGAIGLMRIPAFGKDFEVPILAGTDLDTLSRGVGHYRSTALPGHVGNFAVAGHRITHGQPFAKLLELRSGDQVVVETRSSVYTYVIDEAPKDLTVKAKDSWVLDPVPGKPTQTPTEALITLTTCQDLFHSPDRSVGFGHLASTTNKG